MTEFDRSIGNLEARVSAVEREMKDLKTDMRIVRDTLTGARGGVKTLLLVITISSAVGALATKLPLIFR